MKNCPACNPSELDMTTSNVEVASIQGDASFWSKLLDTSDYPPRWACGHWTPFEGWLHILSDLTTFVAYTSIPIVLAYFISRRKDIPFTALFWIFAAFIFACGTTHLLEAIIFWEPVYRLSGLAKLFTAIISVTALVVLIKNTPKALLLPGLAQVNSRLKDEIDARKLREEELATANERLIGATRIGKFGYWSWKIGEDHVTWSDNMWSLFKMSSPPSSPINFETAHSPFSNRSKTVAKEALDKLLNTGQSQVYDVSLEGDDEHIFEVLAVGVVGESGEISRLHGTVQDVSQRRKDEKLILQKSLELTRANHDLETFAYAASHDLREPVRKARFYIEMLRKSKDEEIISGNLNRLEGNMEKMQGLIDGLLKLCSTRQAEEDFSPLDLNLLLNEVADALSHEIDHVGGKIILNKMPTILGQKELLVQVFENLIQNSIKFRDENRSLQIVLSYLEQETDWHVIIIEDNGIGIDSSQAEKIMLPFQRSSKTQNLPGFGIGLALCRTIIEAHGGNITVDTQRSEGASFLIRFPRKK